MNNYNQFPRQSSGLTIEKINGHDHVYDPESEISVPFDMSNPDHLALLPKEPATELGYGEHAHVRSKNKRRYTFGSRLAIGGFAVGMLMTPFAHKAAEKATYDVLNAMNPFEDKVLEQTTVWEDVMNSVGNITGSK